MSKKAEQLADIADKAYDCFKSNATNVAQVNAALAAVLTAAEARAKLGEFSCTFALGNLDVDSSNSTLFQRYLGELLRDLDYVVNFTATVKENWVLLDWSPEDINGN